MGMEVTQQALPADWPLLARACTDSQIAELVAFVPSWIVRPPTPRGDDTAAEREVRAACAALRAHDAAVATADLRIDLDRDWDIIHHLLSPRRRAGAPADDGAVAVHGHVPLAKDARAGQGAPVMWSAPNVVARVADFLEEPKDVRAAFDPDALEAAGTYKLFVRENGEAEMAERCERVVAAIGALARTYRNAAARRWGVLVVLD